MSEAEESYINIDLPVTFGTTFLQESPISIWPFDDAPEWLQSISVNGGDEDWLVVVKKELYEARYIGFLERGNSGCIGSCCIDVFDPQNGFLILIGSHS